MSKFEQTLQDIRDLKIQGAARIAKAALRALAEHVDDNLSEQEILLLKTKVFETRPNEPMMRNIVNRFFYQLGLHTRNVERSALEVATEILEELEKEETRIEEIGARLLRGKSTIYTHCHSSTVTRIISAAVQSGLKLRVYCTETRPKYQGRTTARELAARGIEVIHLVDSAGLIALKHADVFLLGADAILATGFFINKVGSGLLALASEWNDVPLYVAAHTLKFDQDSNWGIDEQIEQRPASEVWPDCPSGIKIINPAFEKIPTKYVEAFITEKGLLNAHGIQEAAR